MPDLLDVEYGFLNDELNARATKINSNDINQDGEFVLVWLRQTIRGHSHPTIDAAVSLGNSINKPVIVIHVIEQSYPKASDRLHYFLIGASKEAAKTLKKRKIEYFTYIEQDDAHYQTYLTHLAKNAMAIFTDEHFTTYRKKQVSALSDGIITALFVVDATRLIPIKALPNGLKATKSFRAAHSPNRDKWLEKRIEVKPICKSNYQLDTKELINLHSIKKSEIDKLISQCSIDHDLAPVKEHPPERKIIVERLKALSNGLVEKYRANRNNPAIEDSTSQLSPYLHFGMISPWEVMDVVEKSVVSKSVRWKFYDELLTWREWSHWRMATGENYENYSSLSNSVLKTLDAHKDDDREVLLTLEQLKNGETPDETWNAAQIYWRKTGWLHNNLRMYWSKQILKWTNTPEEAWNVACYLNDYQSLDGRDPAAYVSMRWAFGEAKPAYIENPIYGWVAKRGDSALIKRKGFIEWRDNVLNSL